MSGRSHAHPGHLLAALGAALLVGSLWLPWYEFRFPETALPALGGLAGQLGALGPLIQEGARTLVALGPVDLSAWDVLKVIPALCLAAGAIAGGLALLAATGRAEGVERAVGAFGLVGVALPLYRLVVRPGPGALLHVGWGLPAAIAGGVLIVVGGELAVGAAARRPAARPGYLLDLDSPPALPTPWATTDSVAPPGPRL